MSFVSRKFCRLAALAICVGSCMPGMVVAQPDEHAPVEAAREAAHEAAGDPNPLAFRTDLALWTLFVFLILFGLLSFFAWPQIAAALDEREKKITDNIAAAEARNEEAKRLLAEHEAKLAAAAGEVRELLEEARRDADHTRKSIAEKGRQDAQAELDRALREIDRAKDAAVQDLAVASANVAIDLARKVIQEKITPDQQNAIVREALAKLATTGAGQN